MELLLRREASEEIAGLLLAEGEVVHAPHLLDIEVAQVLRRLENAGTLSASRAREAIEDLHALRVVRHPHLALLDRVWELRSSFSAYDALYVALAEALEAPLVTTDRRLSRAPGHDADVVTPGGGAATRPAARPRAQRAPVSSSASLRSRSRAPAS